MKDIFKRNSGFTLIELLVVVIILGLLAGLVGPSVWNKLSGAKQKAAQVQIEMFGTVLSSYRLDCGTYPTTDQGLSALRNKPTIPPVPKRWDGPYLERTIPLDPWGEEYIYRSPGDKNKDGYDLVSYGRDGKPGGTGEDADISNFEK